MFSEEGEEKRNRFDQYLIILSFRSVIDLIRYLQLF